MAQENLSPKVDCHIDFIPRIGKDLPFSFFPVVQNMAIIENFLGRRGLPLLQGSRRVEKP